MRKFILLLFLVFKLLQGYSQNVSLQTAQQVATNWYRHYAPAGKQMATISKTTEYKYRNATNFYIFSFNKGGFAMVSANDQAEPVLGYGFEGAFSDSIASPEAKNWFDGYARQIDTLNVVSLKSAKVNPKWEDLLQNRFLKSGGSGIGPLITTTWDQSPYYNDLCPTIDGVRSPTGCVATAMAQIMKYWNYPTTGKDSISYQIISCGTISANFGKTSYQWAQMPGKVSSPNNAVATLMYHCGASVFTIYESAISGASGGNVPEALTRFFDYSANIEAFSRNEYSNSNWTNLLTSELDLGHPIFYAGNSENGLIGHTFVCDGYQNADYFHFNWGWGGNSDGYFYLNDLNVGGGLSFTKDQSAILNIIPNQLPNGYKGIFLSTNSISLNPKEGISPAIKISVTSSANWSASSDQAWLTISPGNGTVGTSTLSLTSTENILNSDRTAIVTITATGYPKQYITVKQYRTVKSSAGNLHDILSSDLATSTSLTISGTMDARDFKTIRDEMPLLKKLDLSDATIVEYRGTGGTSGDTNILYPANVIPNHAFTVPGTWQGKTLMKSVLLPGSLTAVGDYAFYNCRALSSIILPSKVTKIGDAAFSGCGLLATAYIPPTVTTIGNFAFYYCFKLVLDPISSSVNSIGNHAFTCIKGSFIVDPANPNYSSQDGVLYNKDKTRLMQCPNSIQGNFIVPSTVKTIEKSAFLYGNIISISLPSSLNTIGELAFSNCRNIKSLTIPASVKSIEGYAFENWFSLTSVTVNSSEPIDLSNSPGVFWKMDRAKVTLKVPFGSKSAYQTADQWKDFTNIVEMQDVIISASSMQLGASKNSGSVNIASGVSWTATSNQQWLTLSSGTGVPGNSTLILNVAENSTLSARLATVTVSAAGFTDKTITVTQLARVTVTPGGLHDLLSSVLATTTSLSLGGTIDARDFKTMRDEMPLLAAIDLSGATIVAYNGTEGTSNTITTYAANTIPQNAFMGCTGLITVSFPPSTISIETSAFLSCLNLSSIYISASLTSIATNAFGNSPCSITVDESNPNYSSLDGVLYDKAKSLLIKCPYSKTGSFSIPSSVSTIGFGAFQNSKLNSIVIPSSVKVIEYFSFYNCNNLISISIPSSVSLIQSEAFSTCGNITSIKTGRSIPVDLISSVNVFKGINKANCILYVPYGTKLLYAAANQWKDFANIVEMPNQAPVANAGADQSVGEGSNVTLDGSGSSDLEGNSITYKWTAPSGIALSSISAAKPTFTAPKVVQLTTYSFTLMVNDGLADSPADQVAISVNPLPAGAGSISGVSTVCQGQNSVMYSLPVIANASSYIWTLPNGATGTSTINSISVSYGSLAVSGNISAKGHNHFGDGVSSSFPVTVNPMPANAGTITGTSSLCQGQVSVNYNVPVIANATSYIWTLPSGAIGTSTTNVISVSYEASAVSGNITVKGHNDCGDGVAATFAVTVNPVPNTPIVTQNGKVLHSDVPTGNQWYNQNVLITGANTQDYTITAVGEYTVITLQNGCLSKASNMIKDVVTGISSIENNERINVYPNPVTDGLTLEANDNIKKIGFKIFNQTGLEIFNGNFFGITIVDTSSFSSGIYIIRFDTGKAYEFKKIVKSN